MSAWLSDSREYEARLHRPAWTSVIDDLRRAAKLGPRTTGCVPALSDLLTALSTLPGHGTSVERIGATAALRSTLGQLGSIAAVNAAFDDLVEACQCGSASWTTIKARRGAFRAALRASDRSPDRECRLLTDILDGGRFDLERVLCLLGDGGVPSFPPADHDADGGLTNWERLKLCHRVLQADFLGHRYVVWIIYNNARVEPWQLQVGPVIFFDGPNLVQILKDVAEQDVPFLSAQLPSELLDSPHWMPQWPDSGQWVAARIDLGDTRHADPVAAGRDQADAIVSLAEFASGADGWSRLGGYVEVIDGAIHTLANFGDFSEVSNDWELDVSEAIEALAPTVAAHVQRPGTPLHELVDATRTIKSAPDTSDIGLVVLHVRAIELVAARCGTGWRDHLATFAIDWARGEALNRIFEAADSCLSDAQLRTHAIPDAVSIKGTMLTSAGGRQVRIHHDCAIAVVLRLADELPIHHPHARRVREVARRLQSPGSVAAWIDELQREYDCMVDRLSRYRNAISHGGPLNESVTASIAPFARLQARDTLGIAIRAVLNDEGVALAHQNLRNQATQWRSALPNAADVIAALTA
jgi:hypothetical protein